MSKPTDGPTIAGVLMDLEECAARKDKKWDPLRCPTCIVSHTCWPKPRKEKQDD